MKANAMSQFVQYNHRQLSVIESLQQSIGQKQLLDLLHGGFRVLSGEITDRLLARAALEVRRPFNAVRLVQFSFATPARLRLFGGVNKYIHVRALEGILPSQVCERRTKAEFSSVFRAYLDQMDLIMTETITGKRPECLSTEGMRRLYATYREAKQQGLPLWVLWAIYLCHIVNEVE